MEFPFSINNTPSSNLNPSPALLIMDRLSSFPIHYRPRKAISLFLNLSFLLTISFYTIFIVSSNDQPRENTIDTFLAQENSNNLPGIDTDACAGVYQYTDQKSKCAYVKSNPGCRGKGYINYLEIFYCNCGEMPGIGYLLLLLWIVLLFYLLADTSAEYFCPSVESLSEQLKLSPTIAGTTLLPFGNGANDVFSSIISFTQSSNGDIGLNSVLGGACFISCFVVGTICVLISSHRTRVDERSFIRDGLFFLFSLSCLLMIITFGSINLWVAICFASIYLIYICTVSAMQFFSKKIEKIENPAPAAINILPTSKGGSFARGGTDEFAEMSIPLLGCVDEEKGSNGSDHHHHHQDQNNQKQNLKYWFNFDARVRQYISWFVSALELPLLLPRRLTIPIISEKKWSKTFALSCAILAPIFIAALVNTRVESIGSTTSLAIYILAGIISIFLGNIVFVFTTDSTPPKKCLLPWLIGGFLMSITWTYLLVEELVGTLVSIGTILGINPSILGLTVLAWGNSVADLTSNVAMALHGGPSGAQVAMSSCYAGPLFNTLMGLGLSLVFASWSVYPSPYVIPKDPSLYETVGFLICGLLWALVVLPKRNMQLDKFLGGGLFAIYLCFLFLRLARAFG